MGLFDFFRKKKEIPLEPVFVEKRFLPRWKISTPAKIKLAGASDYIDCQIKDLNMRGFCLATTEKISECDGAMEIRFNDKYFFFVEVSFTWHKEIEGKQAYGLRFLKVRDSDREKIYSMMKENFSSCFGKLI